MVGNVYPNKFERSQIVESGREDTITSVVEKFRAFEPKAPEGGRPIAEEIELANQQLNKITVRLAGRIASPPRVMGKAAFVHLSDGVSRLQVYVRKADVKAVNNDTRALIEDEGKGWELFGLLDHGDFIGVEGFLFVTKTGELSVHVQQLQFLAKALVPLPDKMHGIHDPEIRQRQRYADLIAGSLKLERVEGELTPREVFERRSAVIRELRRILEDHGYIEVETPMLTPLATGAAARPFKTHHNALDIDLYARIAPELYLKRLLVGGFEKVYELNRNFRNEGIDRQHNPEFTMLEFYWAYADVNAMMDFCEEMIRATVFKVLGHTHVKFGEQDIDFSQPFERLSMRGAVERLGPPEIAQANLLELFDQHVEFKLIQPTFIIDFPKVISPLSKASPLDSTIAERFELFITGMECANGFSELNDPAEQYERFMEQTQQRERGDEEAMVMDEDYIRALSYGMPPAAGIGIGIDRFVMLLTNRQSIRDVILFPHLRPERKQEPESEPPAVAGG
jgi:lysyl-tRNA synthetase class 2